MALVRVPLYSSAVKWTSAPSIAPVRASGPHDSVPNCRPLRDESRREIVAPIASARTGSRGGRAVDHACIAGCAIGDNSKAWQWFEIVNVIENQMK